MRPPSPELNTRIVGAIATAATWYEKNARRATLEHRPADVPGSLARSPVAGRRSNALVQSCVGGLPQSASAAGCVAPLTAQKVLTRLAGRYIEEDGGRRGLSFDASCARCWSCSAFSRLRWQRLRRRKSGSACCRSPNRSAPSSPTSRVTSRPKARGRGHEIRSGALAVPVLQSGPHRHRVQQHGLDVAGDRARPRCGRARAWRGRAHHAARHDDGPHRAQGCGEVAQGARGQARRGQRHQQLGVAARGRRVWRSTAWTAARCASPRCRSRR